MDYSSKFDSMSLEHCEQSGDESSCINVSVGDVKPSEDNTCEPEARLVTMPVAETETQTEFRWRKFNRKQIMILVAINSIYLLARLNFSLAAPLFPKEANEKGVNVTITGWIFGVFSLVQFIISPFYRRFLPKFGCRSLLISGLFLCGVSTISFGLVTYVDTTKSIALFVVCCFMARAVLALSCTLIDNTGLVLLVQHFPSHVATLMGVGEIFTGIGYISGPALGGLLYSTSGFILPFVVAGSVAMLAVPVFCCFVPKDYAAPVAESSDLRMFQLLVHPVSLTNSIVVLVSAVAWSVLDPILEPHLRQHGLLPDKVGMMFVVTAAFYSLTSPFWGRVADLIVEKRILNIIGIFLLAVGFVWIGPSPLLGLSNNYNYLWYTAISMGIIGTASAMVVISTYTVYIDILKDIGCPQNNKSYGLASGLWVSMYSLGFFIGPSIGGILFDHIGFVWLTTSVAVLCLVTSVLECVSLLVLGKCKRKLPGYPDDRTITSDNTEELIALNTCKTRA